MYLYKSNTKYIQFGLIIWCFVSGLVCSQYYGLGILGGDSVYYLRNAREIIENGIEYYIHHIRTPYYWGYPSFLAIIIEIFGENYALISLIQIALSSCSVVLLYRIVFDITKTRLISLIIPAIYRLILNVWMWDCYILSDSLGASFEMCTIYCAWQYQYKKGKLFPFISCSILFFITRTNSIILIFVFICSIYIRESKDRKHLFEAFFLIVVLCLILLFVSSNGVQHGLPERLSYYIGLYRRGIVIYEKHAYDYVISPDHKGLILFGDYFIVFLKRLLFFWSVYYYDFSLPHKVFQLFTLLPLWFFTVFSVYKIILKKCVQLFPYVIGIIAYNVAQALTEVDDDMRYRMPVFLLIMIVCSYGISEVQKSIRQNRGHVDCFGELSNAP